MSIGFFVGALFPKSIYLGNTAMSSGVRTVGVTKSSDVPFLRSKGFLIESRQMHTLPNLLRQDIGSMVPDTTGKKKFETDKFAPVVAVNDLMKGDGDTVQIELHHNIVGQPTMCCDVMEGNEEDMTFSDFDLRINQTRHGVNTNCTMDKQRLGRDAMKMAKPLLQQWYCQLEHERMLYQLAGARGHFYNPENMIIPFETHKKFLEQMVNCVEAPTYCRHYYAGEAQSFDGSNGTAIAKTDIFNLSSISMLKASMEEASHPLLPIRLADSEGRQTEPFWLLLVTPRQWATFQKSTEGKEWRDLIANAVQRSKGCSGHPLFQGDCLFYENILVKKYSQPIRFLPGKPVRVSCDDDCATTTVQRLDQNADFAVDRAMLLGGQAVAEAYGGVDDADGKHLGKMNFQFWSESWDGGDKSRVHIKFIGGCKKIRFANRNGEVYDRGVAVLDSAVPLQAGRGC